MNLFGRSWRTKKKKGAPSPIRTAISPTALPRVANPAPKDDFNFTDEPGTKDPGPPAAPAEAVFNPDHEREHMRSRLALILVYLLAATVFAIVYFIDIGKIPGTVVVESVFPSVVALAGTALGFYFGGQQSRLSSIGTQPRSRAIEQPHTRAGAAKTGDIPPPLKVTSGETTLEGTTEDVTQPNATSGTTPTTNPSTK